VTGNLTSLLTSRRVIANQWTPVLDGLRNVWFGLMCAEFLHDPSQWWLVILVGELFCLELNTLRPEDLGR
jgi:hypothetical protein